MDKDRENVLIGLDREVQMLQSSSDYSTHIPTKEMYARAAAANREALEILTKYYADEVDV